MPTRSRREGVSRGTGSRRPAGAERITPRLLVWAEAAQEAMLREAAAECGGQIAAVGSPSAGVGADLAMRLGAEHVTDLRAALLRSGIDGVILAATRELKRLPPTAVDDSRLVFATEALEVSCGGIGQGASIAAPLFRFAPGMLAAADAVAAFGSISAASFMFRCMSPQSTLGARLFDAMDTMRHLLGDCEQISASQPFSAAETPETICGLHDELAFHARFADSRCASGVLCDRAPWNRTITMLGGSGVFTITDGGFAWTDSAGDIVDSFDDGRSWTQGALLGREIRRRLDLVTADESGTEAALALCHAARLSCRTGQAEEPRRLIEIMSHP